MKRIVTIVIASLALTAQAETPKKIEVDPSKGLLRMMQTYDRLPRRKG